MHDVAKAVEIGISLTTLALRALEANAKVEAMVSKAASEGRSYLTPEEWTTLFEADDLARQGLASKIGA